jgi:pyruvate/2-oxoacid:ferredoxin oxidoreductase beta subunit/Pyruvate/2-oxoacid:ferredoxin oxidoreductase delta subunit
MSEPKLTHDALAELDRVVRDFRVREGVESDFALETHPELGRSLLDLDIEQYVEEFGRVTTAYQTGLAGEDLPAEAGLARSLIPPGTGRMRDFSYIGREIPEFLQEKCVACMECVTECPDTAILAKVLESGVVEEAIARDQRSEELQCHWSKTRKFHDTFEKSGDEPGLFGIFIDPTKCKGCGECVEVCGDHGALQMIRKSPEALEQARHAMEHFHSLPETSERFIRERIPTDRMLACEKTHLYIGGAGSCSGCGEATALRMLMAQVGWQKGRENVGIVAATGCNTVYSSTYPYNPFLVPWISSLFENAPAVAMGIRKRWDQRGWEDKSIWVVGGDGAMFDIGFGSLSRMLSSGLDINVLVLDTQVYSNTGGQASTSSFTGQMAKMAPHGAVQKGKVEPRKDIARIAMMHPAVFVAQTTAAHVKHFYDAVAAATTYPGPSIVVVYSTCQPEHGVGDALAAQQAKLAVESRAYPLMVHDPRRGDRLRERLDLKGNPSLRADWHQDKQGQVVDFLRFARSEGRFRRQFGREGEPSPEILAAQERVLRRWRLLQEMAGVIA